MYASPLAGFELTTLVVIGTDFIGSFKSIFHTIKTTTVTRREWLQIVSSSDKNCIDGAMAIMFANVP